MRLVTALDDAIGMVMNRDREKSNDDRHA